MSAADRLGRGAPAQLTDLISLFPRELPTHLGIELELRRRSVAAFRANAAHRCLPPDRPGLREPWRQRLPSASRPALMSDRGQLSAHGQLLKNQ